MMMKKVLFAFIACMVTLGVDTHASAKDEKNGPVIEVVKGTAKVMREKATATLVFDWSNAYWMDKGLMKDELPATDYENYTTVAPQKFQESFNDNSKGLKIIEDPSADYEIKIVVSKIDYFFSVMSFVPGHKHTFYGKVIVTQKTTGEDVLEVVLTRFKGGRDFKKDDSLYEMFKDLGKKISSLKK